MKTVKNTNKPDVTEMVVLGYLILDNRLIKPTSYLLDQHDFKDKSTKLVWNAIEHIHAKGDRVELLSLGEYLKRPKTKQRVSKSFLTELLFLASERTKTLAPLLENPSYFHPIETYIGKLLSREVHEIFERQYHKKSNQVKRHDNTLYDTLLSLR